MPSIAARRHARRSGEGVDYCAASHYFMVQSAGAHYHYCLPPLRALAAAGAMIFGDEGLMMPREARDFASRYADRLSRASAEPSCLRDGAPTGSRRDFQPPIGQPWRMSPLRLRRSLGYGRYVDIYALE